MSRLSCPITCCPQKHADEPDTGIPAFLNVGHSVTDYVDHLYGRVEIRQKPISQAWGAGAGWRHSDVARRNAAARAQFPTSPWQTP